MKAICPVCPRVGTDRNPFWTAGPITLDQSIQAIGVSAACAEAGIYDALLSVAAPPQPLRRRRLASASAGGATGPSAATGRLDRRSAARRRDRRSALGRAAAGGVRAAAVATPGGLQDSVAPAAPAHGSATRRVRLLVLEHHSARDAGLLTQRARRRLAAAASADVARGGRGPGGLLCLDTFYIGKLKGVGKVWQVTARDVAGSYGGARILPALTAAGVAAFLPTVVVSAVRQVGCLVERKVWRT